MEKIVLSVIVPSYNVEMYIMDLLNSVYADGKEEKRLEMIFVDDGATDNTVSVIRSSKYANYEGIIILKKENGGHGSCINYALSYVHGKYVRIIDGDDWVNTSGFEKYLDYLEKADADLIVDSYSKFYVDSKQTELFDGLNKLVGNYSGKIDPLLRRITGSNHYILMPMITIKTEALKDSKPIDEKIYYDDAEFNALCIVGSDTVELINMNVYQYRIGRIGQSTDPTISLKHTDDKVKVINYVLEIIKSEISTYKKSYLERYISKTAADCLVTCINAGKRNGVQYSYVCSIDKEILEKNKNVYALMEKQGKKIVCFRKFKRLFYELYSIK